MLLITFALGLAQIGEPPAPASKPPEVPAELRAEFFKQTAVYHAINEHYQESMKEAILAEQSLDRQRAIVDAATKRMGAACGEKFEVDAEKLKRLEVVCIAKPDPSLSKGTTPK